MTTAADIKTKASEVLEDKLHATKRVLKHTAHDLEDLRDLAGLRIRRDPVASVTIALATGVVVGCVIGYLGSRRA